ncbi:amino acid ABC transporter permease [Methylovirgula sp. 4M-Z18]|uniref:amino acid ABC transporter permease n=1 Tax=Methylovirgula sp. 4M-Z18 TaxID=2293567 RepID=UPI000E2F25F5|nr:amino acid ABC transporter permease [Methylovirgula sp. 4M-Z18]RFB80313.1 amino acid ABC transporter permease [Methylovirgula sp. 4M-Z18]
MSQHISDERPRVSPLNNPRVRSYAFQAAVILALGFVGYEIVENTRQHMAEHNMVGGFDFLSRRAGFKISQALIAYSEDSSYGRAYVTGLLNTLLVAGLGIPLATMLGFMVGIARLSKNYVVSQLATIYVEAIRNTPLLLQLFFWYFAIINFLPNPRQSHAILGAFFTQRGLFLPAPVYGDGANFVGAALLIAIGATVAFRLWAGKRQRETGAQYPKNVVTLALLVVLPGLAYFAAGQPISLDYPQLKGFNLAGGMTILPELLALLAGLVIYTGSYIAEIVRAGILAIPKGQTEASFALGLRPQTAMKLVIIPQALRVIIPPLISQFLNLTKNSTLAVAIGYPDLTSVWAGTALNQTGQALETILMTMLTYLAVSLLTSMVMNWYNSRKRLVER